MSGRWWREDAAWPGVVGVDDAIRKREEGTRRRERERERGKDCFLFDGEVYK
jgi:hypothetical protein